MGANKVISVFIIYHKEYRMKQLNEYTRLVKELFTKGLQEEGREKLNNSELIGKIIYAQWEASPHTNSDKRREERMHKQILSRITPNARRSLKQSLNPYGWVASITLLLVCGALSVLLFTRPSEVQTWYVVKAGRQSMDSVRLADGTLVMLNASSKLTDPEHFSGDKREVLLSGQAFFKVEPDPKRPFIVKTKKMDVTALGTSFEVFSFDEDKNAETILLSGCIKVAPKSKEGTCKKEFILSPNERLSYIDRKTIHMDSVNANTYSAWRTGESLCFKNEKLAMILPRLEKWYGQKVKCDAKLANHYRFTFTLRKESLDFILNIMSQNTPLTYRLEKDDCYILEERKR